MIGDTFVFDCVCHVYDFSPANQRKELREMEPMMYGWRIAMDSMKYQPQMGEFAGDFDWETKFTTEQMYEMEFVQSPVDMAMACAVPVWDWFQDSFSSIEAQHAFASAYPERVLLSGGVDPIHHGLHGAKVEMIRQKEELGARSFKFYNGHIDKSWRCDDRELAYPLYEQAMNLGVDVLQFHKGLPFGMWDVDVLRPVDLQRPARDFPDLKFVIHHLALPYFDEVVSIASRFPNVYLALSGVLSFYKVAPRQVQEQMGRLLMEVGPDKLMWGSEAAMTGAPAPFLEDFVNLEIPDDLRQGYGYPQITHSDKEKILGLNMARLFNVDVEAKKAEFKALGEPASQVSGGI
ncbi:amidohydrolase family protein [Streptosporangium subroseum]|uniref:amidohydrolase family protein n=1 Tax=Streptosporangium subroseum TaxID=106412 RepID=UPI003092CB4A|nr:amidohydrolase family protein [Streptosporangium subroseum]